MDGGGLALAEDGVGLVVAASDGGLVWATNRGGLAGGWLGSAMDGGGLDCPADGCVRRALENGGLVLAQGRTLSRHQRIPSLHLSPVVSGRSTGRWELALCQNSERMVASSSASLQNAQEYRSNGRSRRPRAMK